MIRWIVIAVLGIGIAGTAFWGYQEHEEKNAILVQAENNYQRAFHDLSYHLDLLHDKIGTSLAMNSNQSLSPQLVDIWRLSSEALTDVGQLPLGLLPFNKTEEFLSNIGDFTYRAAVRNLEDEPLSDEETENLKELYAQSSEIKDEIRQIQHISLDNNLRWMDVQLALADEEAQIDNTIVDGFKTMEETAGEFSETNVDSSIIGTSSPEHEYKNLTGNKVSEEDALDITRNLIDVENEDNVNITESGEGSKIPLYSISYRNEDKNAYMDMSQQGGHPLSLLIDRPINGREISLNEGLKEAEAYLEELNLENMTLFQSSQYNNMGHYSFLHEEDGVRVFSDALEVKVALDDGEILGFTANNYYMNHTERDIPEPEISVEEAKDKVNAGVDIQEEFLAVIDNDLGEEVLAHEFLGVMDGETYRIFINAMDGREEKVERLRGTEINYSAGF
jgi:spore germination protein